jgi:hypothetical protein
LRAGSDPHLLLRGAGVTIGLAPPQPWPIGDHGLNCSTKAATILVRMPANHLIALALEFTRRTLMKRIDCLLNPTTARVFAVGVLVAATSLVSGSVIAAESTSTSRVEMRIHDMHAKLAITAEQEDQWKQVAGVMRDNELALEPLIKDRKTNANTMTAIDDLKSYAGITNAHLEGIKKFTTSFETLYDSMSEAQKKDADALFRKGSQKMAKVK